MCAEGHALEHTREREHLAHTRSAAWPLVAHDDDIARVNAIVAERGDGVLLTIEDARRSAKRHLVLVHGADFDHRALRREIAEQDRQCAARRMRPGERANAGGVPIGDAGEILA